MHISLNQELFCTIQQKEEFERNCEGEREDSSVPLFSPICIKIMLLFHVYMGFCSKVGVLGVKCEFFLFDLIGVLNQAWYIFRD